MTWSRGVLRPRAGRWAGVAFAAVAVAALSLALVDTFGDSDAVASSRTRTFICSETGKSFRHEIVAGEATPVRSPHTGRQTGYPAELCYWTTDGRIKDEPTAVLLDAHVERRGATFCPDCDRLVVGHNPRPEPGDAPPPLKGQYKPAKKEGQDEP